MTLPHPGEQPSRPTGLKNTSRQAGLCVLKMNEHSFIS